MIDKLYALPELLLIALSAKACDCATFVAAHQPRVPRCPASGGLRGLAWRVVAPLAAPEDWPAGYRAIVGVWNHGRDASILGAGCRGRRDIVGLRPAQRPDACRRSAGIARRALWAAAVAQDRAVSLYDGHCGLQSAGAARVWAQAAVETKRAASRMVPWASTMTASLIGRGSQAPMVVHRLAGSSSAWVALLSVVST